MTKPTTHIRCASPDCNWSISVADLNETQLNRAFREHCIDRHGLSPDDTERLYWFDLEALTLTLLEQ